MNKIKLTMGVIKNYIKKLINKIFKNERVDKLKQLLGNLDDDTFNRIYSSAKIHKMSKQSFEIFLNDVKDIVNCMNQSIPAIRLLFIRNINSVIGPRIVASDDVDTTDSDTVDDDYINNIYDVIDIFRNAMLESVLQAKAHNLTYDSKISLSEITRTINTLTIKLVESVNAYRKIDKPYITQTITLALDKFIIPMFWSC